MDISNSFRLCSRLPVVVSSSALSAASLLSRSSPEQEVLPDAEQESPFVPDEQVLVQALEAHVLVPVEEEQVVLLLPFDEHEAVPFVSAEGQDVPAANAGSVNHAAVINTVVIFVIFKWLIVEDSGFLSFSNFYRNQNKPLYFLMKGLHHNCTN